MDSTIKSYQNSISINKNEAAEIRNLNFWENLEFNRFGIIPMLLVFITCMGGIAVAFGAGSDTLELSMVTFPTIITLAMLLAVAPMRLIMWGSAIAIIMDLLVFLF